MKRSRMNMLIFLAPLLILCLLIPGGGFSRVEAAARVWCCANGQVTYCSPNECVDKGGTQHATQVEAIRACMTPKMVGEAVEGTVEAIPRGYCCYKGNVFPSTPTDCDKLPGTYYATEEEAKARCQPPPNVTWCCYNGQVFTAPPSQCSIMGGTSHSSRGDALCACQEVPAAGWCCANKNVFSTTEQTCAGMGGQFYWNPNDAMAACQTVSAEVPVYYCCVDGEVYAVTSQDACDDVFDTAESAQQYCLDAAGFCCADGEVSLMPNAYRCEEINGDFFGTLEEAQEACGEVPSPPWSPSEKGEPTETVYCCRGGAIFVVPEPQCSAMDGISYGDDLSAARARCCQESEDSDEVAPSTLQSWWDDAKEWLEETNAKLTILYKRGRWPKFPD